MPTYPSRLRLEPLLQISQTLAGPPPPETQLLQSIEVYPTQVKIYFGFLFHLLIFQSLWTIEIALRMVLHWETTGDSVTPSPSPSPIPIQPPFITPTPAPPSPNNSSYHEADEGIEEENHSSPLAPPSQHNLHDSTG